MSGLSGGMPRRMTDGARLVQCNKNMKTITKNLSASTNFAK